MRAGITRSVAKKLSRHLTDRVFERYDIVDEGELLDPCARPEDRPRRDTEGKQATAGQKP